MKVEPTEIRRRRGIFLLPNLLTTCCLFGGFYAIVASIDGNFERAAMAIFGAISAVVRATPTQRPEEIRNGFVRVISAIFQSSRFKKANSTSDEVK